jgi:protein-L-isoaspartate(D-aspartate) O-methyltransferase
VLRLFFDAVKWTSRHRFAKSGPLEGRDTAMTNFAAQRAHMVHSQLMPNTVTEPRLLQAMGAISRENFVPPERRSVAYADRPIPLAEGRVLLDPMTLARLIQLAAIGEHESVLIVGCNAGYSAAIIARLAQDVVAVDESQDLVTTATANLAALKIGNVTVQHGGHAEGLAASGPYDAIIIEGRVSAVPDTLLNQLKEAGRLVAIVGEDGAAKATLYLRSGDTFGMREAFDAAAAALPLYAAKRPAFVF